MFPITLPRKEIEENGYPWRPKPYSSQSLLLLLFLHPDPIYCFLGNPEALYPSITDMASLRPVLPLLMVAVLIAVEERISGPSCMASGRGGEGASHPDDLKVMMVADLLLLGSDASYADTFFRDSFTSKFFRVIIASCTVVADLSKAVCSLISSTGIP